MSTRNGKTVGGDLVWSGPVRALNEEARIHVASIQPL